MFSDLLMLFVCLFYIVYVCVAVGCISVGGLFIGNWWGLIIVVALLLCYGG